MADTCSTVKHCLSKPSTYRQLGRGWGWNQGLGGVWGQYESTSVTQSASWQVNKWGLGPRADLQHPHTMHAGNGVFEGGGWGVGIMGGKSWQTKTIGDNTQEKLTGQQLSLENHHHYETRLNYDWELNVSFFQKARPSPKDPKSNNQTLGNCTVNVSQTICWQYPYVL